MRHYDSYGYGRPYGDIFSVQTPHLDQMSNRLYLEELDRKKQERENNKSLDELMRLEVGKIRSADTNEFIDAWQKYKDAKMPLYNPKVQRDPKEVARINREANIHLANAMQIANNSIETKEQLKNIPTTVKSIERADNFNSRYGIAMNTPSSKIENHPEHGNLIDPDTYYSQANISNLQSIFSKGKGTLKKVGSTKIEPYDKLKMKSTNYEAYNSPLEYYQNVIGSLRGSRMQKDFLQTYHFTPDEAQNIIQQYNEKVKNNPLYKEAFGSGIEFPESADLSDVSSTAKLMAMEYALGEGSIKERSTLIDNAKAMIDYKSDKIKERIYLNHALPEKGASALVNDLSDVIYQLPKDADGYDVSRMLGGIKTTTLPTGKQFPAVSLKYNPKTRVITWVDINNEKHQEDINTFKSNLPTTNTVQDLKVVDAISKIGGIKAEKPKHGGVDKNPLKLKL